MKYIKISILLLLFACESRTVKISGLNDLVVGVQQIVLYENGEFYLELGAGGKTGKYEIIQDTVYLSYNGQPESFPTRILITEEFFVTINNKKDIKPIKISRAKN